MPRESLGSTDLTPDVVFALETLVHVVERKSGEFRASVLLVSADGRRLLDAAAPSLPRAYREAINGFEIGPQAGSCGTAAHLNQRVVVTDIERDPLWENFREHALPHGLRSCWSQPIRSASGEVLGTFAMYYPEPREPTAEELNIIEAAAQRAGVMIDKARRGAHRTELVAGLS